MWALDYLGGAKYKKTILDTHPPGWGAGFFAETFGNAYPLVDALAATGTCPAIRIHLLWSDTHKFGDKDIPEVRRLAKKYEALAKKYSTVKFYLSPFCEHNLANPGKYLRIVEVEAPSCIPVNTPWKGAMTKRYKNELHGNQKRMCDIYSFDGMPCVDADVEQFKARYQDNELFFFWTSQCNGRKNPSDPTPRPERKAWPTPDLLKSLVALSEPRGATSLPRSWIWKSHADQHLTPPEPRALKPVLISPLKVERFQLIYRGKVIATSDKAQPFEDGRWRYYWPDYGYKLCGAPCTLSADGKSFGTVNPGFRQNDYRHD